MKFIIIGSGIVGLSIAHSLIKRKIVAPSNLLIVDKYSLPSNGTSTHNSGVLHAGLYYQPNSLKANLSIEGGIKLKNWCADNNLSILNCGKILVPFSTKDLQKIDEIYNNAIKNGCEVKIINYEDAKKLQPGIIKKEKYLWSPKTAVFSPKQIIGRLYKLLKMEGVEFTKKNIIGDNVSNKTLISSDNTVLKYSRYINCAGPGALEITNTISSKFKHLTILPFLGEYGVQISGLEIKTNLYPVPDPELPFLGIHLTPRINNSTLIGPNAIPVFRRDIQGFELKELKEFPSIILNNFVLFALNKQNYREHSLSELTFNVRNKFFKKSIRYFSEDVTNDFQIKMDKSTYGIRPQLIEKKSLNFVNDFLYEKINENIHIVNAVSPAFTSCFALAEFIVDKL
jgi:L-2-hydroxyglutarate oxidase LhgO